MKKLLTLILALAVILSFASCSLLPDEFADSLEDIKDNIFGGDTDSGDGTDGGSDTGDTSGGDSSGDDSGDDENPGDDGNDPEPPAHTHEFEVVSTKAATCTKSGLEKLECACGEKKENVLEPLGHNMIENGSVSASCTVEGTQFFLCIKCGKSKSETTPALGHDFTEPEEASRFCYCKRVGCGLPKAAFPESGKYSDLLSFTFGDADKAALSAKHEEMLSILKTADKYNSSLHGYDTSGDLYAAYVEAEKVYEEYSDLIYAARDQYSVAMTLYYCNHTVESYQQTYNDMADYYTDLVSDFYSLSQPWYDSMFREFFFYGATEEEIKAFLFDSNALANPEYAALKERNTAIELEFNNIANPITSDLVPELYAEMVANNNRMAELLGYNNYLEYAYADVYGREYTYKDIATYAELVKEYIAPIYVDVYNNYINLANSGNYTGKDVTDYYSIVSDSFFEVDRSNRLFNDYIDMMEMGFTSNPNKQISFSDELNGLVSNGNLFRGTYEGAYVTYLYANKIPIAYFGPEGYDSPLTVSHEFGHYMNEVYNQSEYDQSYDLLETHSQGHEMLFIYFVKDYVTSTGYELARGYHMTTMLGAVVNSLRIDCFEQAIYLNSYDGTYAAEIMADNKITADEYDLLYESIGKDFGLAGNADSSDYWRYGMTITSPCYYISYSISAINALQIYAKIYDEGFDAARDSYLKTITYTDKNPDMTMAEVLEYAGLLSYTDEETYKLIAAAFETK